MTSPNTGNTGTGNTNNSSTGTKLPSTTTVSTASIAVTAAIVWALQTYVLHGNLPGPLSVAVYAVIPAIVGGFFTRHALNQMPPNLDKAIAARWDKKFHADQGTKVVPQRSSLADISPLYRSNLGYSESQSHGNPVQTYGEPPVTAENPVVDDNPYKPGGAA